ncbi:hypothetical protein LQF76_12530 [Gloeomargaritales cyanobacterium VI4D9]|nr:hypothetical protein LQF76_12530 [Gloeomargaritales cyanobacterium VI4D9]
MVPAGHRHRHPQGFPNWSTVATTPESLHSQHEYEISPICWGGGGKVT